MTAPEITVASPADRERVVGSLVAAFTRDPVLRYLFPDEATYPRYAAAFFGYLFDKRVGRRTVWTVGGGVSVAIWEPPAVPVPVPDADAGVGGRSAREGLAAGLSADALARVHAYDEALRAALPAGPFWYLGVLGTHPEHAGRRLGHAVMAAGLRRADADGLPAVLETSNPDNVGVYRRAGWEVVRTVTRPLTIWVMRRDAR